MGVRLFKKEIVVILIAFVGLNILYANCSSPSQVLGLSLSSNENTVENPGYGYDGTFVHIDACSSTEPGSAIKIRTSSRIALMTRKDCQDVLVLLDFNSISMGPGYIIHNSIRYELETP